MIRRIEAIRLSKNNRHIIFFVSLLLIIICFSYYQFFLETPTRNFFMWLLYNFQNLYSTIFAFPLLYLIIINSQFSFNLNNFLYLSRIPNRKFLFISDINLVLKVTFYYMAGIFFISSVLGIYELRFNNSWSQELVTFFKNTFQAIPNTNYSPVFQTGLAFLFFFLYLLTIGNLFNFLFVLLKKKGISFLIIFGMIGLQAYFFKSPTNSLIKIMMPINHYLIYFERANGQFISISISFLYWLSLLVANYSSLYILYKNTKLGD